MTTIVHDALVEKRLLAERHPWQLELYRHDGAGLPRVAAVTPHDDNWIASALLGLALRLQPGKNRPQIELRHSASQRSWRI